MEVSAFMEKSLIKDSMCGVENDIFLYMMLQVIPIVLIPVEYYQFRTWYKFVGMNFTR